MQQTKIQSNAVIKLSNNSMANSSNITNNTESANGELNVVNSATLVTASKQQTKTTDTITHQLNTPTTSPHVITVVTPTSANQEQSMISKFDYYFKMNNGFNFFFFFLI